MTLASSSTPPLPTPSTVTDTPRRLPHMRRMNTPAPLARELTYPNTAPMPVIHSLLGSPFNTKSRYPYDSRSPSWAARGPKEPQGLVVQWQDTAEWMEDNENTTLSPGQLRARPSSSSDEGSEGCASASSFLSSERYAAKQSMRQTVGIWDDEPNLFGDADHHNPATPNRQLFAPKGKGSAFSARVLSPVLTPPFPTRILPGSSSEEDSPVQPFRLARMPSPNLGASTSADPIPMRSPSAGSFLPRRVNSARRAVDSRQRGTTRGVTYDGFLSVSDAPLLGQRRTSEPNSHSTGDAFAAFLARCGGERATQSELCSTNHRRGSPQPPDLSSEPNDLDLDLSPLRSLARSTVPSLPNRPLPAGLPSSPSAPTLGLRSRLDKRNGVTPKAVKATPTRSQSARIPPRPKIHRGVTDSSVPTFGTPVSQLFGDDKPSPAAFASTGLMKKKGGRMMSLPRFQQMVKTRSWTPAKTEPEAAAGTLHGFSTDTEEIQLDDSDEPDQLSPIRPFRSAPFRRTGHTRVNSTASDITATSPFRRPVGAGHARMSSTASSIGGTRGLRRKGSSMFNSSGSIGSAADMVSDNGSPATPTKALPFIPVQPKFGISTPSPTVSRTCYPFDRRMSIDSTSSPTGTPMASTGGRMRVLSRGPIVRASNPMLASTFRAHSSGGPGPAGPVPSTPAVDSAFAETFMTDAARAAGAGRFERDFTLVQALGSGEFSSVWKVRHKNDGDLWAIKTGRPYTGHKNRLRQLEEVSILKQLSHNPHPGIVKYSDSWEQGGRLYIRTELAECGDLARYLGSLGDTSGLDEGRVWKMLVELSSALEFIHNNGILHLDFKPSNVLLTREGSLKVADFGMSIFLHPHGTSASRCPTPTYDDPQEVPLFPSPLLDRELEGDREYLCPEVLHDAAPGPEADVYSLGILVLEAALNIALPSSKSVCPQIWPSTYRSQMANLGSSSVTMIFPILTNTTLNADTTPTWPPLWPLLPVTHSHPPSRQSWWAPSST